MSELPFSVFPWAPFLSNARSEVNTVGSLALVYRADVFLYDILLFRGVYIACTNVRTLFGRFSFWVSRFMFEEFSLNFWVARKSHFGSVSSYLYSCGFLAVLFYSSACRPCIGHLYKSAVYVVWVAFWRLAVTNDLLCPFSANWEVVLTRLASAMILSNDYFSCARVVLSLFLYTRLAVVLWLYAERV